MRKRPTIIDVAEHAGVSKSTVSLVLNKSQLIKKDTYVKVESSLKALNYIYHSAAATLRGSTPGLIGLVINDLRNPFFTEFAASAEMIFSNHGFATVIANTDENCKKQLQVIKSMIEHEIAGLLISPCYGGNGKIFNEILQFNKPVLQVLRCIDKSKQIPFFSMDYHNGGKLATKHLIERGAQKIAFVGGNENNPITIERMSGYKVIMFENDLETNIFYGESTRSRGYNLAKNIGNNHPDIEAILCFNDIIAFGMISGFSEIGKRIGDDILLVGFDDIEECEHCYPKLSSVRCDINSFGKKSAEFILNWLSAGKQPESMTREPVKLIKRQSSLGK